MPAVLRVGGFRVMIYPPPREHRPPHVHVFNSDGEVVIELASGQRPQGIRRVSGMRESDAWIAFRIVALHTSLLNRLWREYHED